MYYWLAFYQGLMEKRNLKPHHLRDGAAFAELSAALHDRGGRYAELVRNGPATREELTRYAKIFKELLEANQKPLVEDIVEYRPVDESFLGKGKVLAAVTRIPMSDLQQEDRGKVQPGFTSIEQKVIRALRPYLPVCSRSKVRLAEALAARLPPGFSDRAEIQFRAYDEPWYTQLRPADRDVKGKRPKRGFFRTAAYLVQLPEVRELNGADLLVMFGPGGTQTLAFAQRLRDPDDLSYLLDHYGFSMIELVVPETAETPEGETPESDPLTFLRHCEVHVLLEGILLDESGQAVRRPKVVRRAKRKKTGSHA